MALSGSLTTNAYGGVRSLTLTWSGTQSVSGNSTTITWTLSGSGSTANYNPWYMTGPTKVVIDGSQVHYSASRIQLRSGTVVASGTRTITHNSDGAKSITIRIEGAIYTTSVNCTAEQTFTLNQIPRGASIVSAPNFKDTDNPKVEYSNPAGASLQVGIYKTDGATALAAYRTATGSSYTFSLTSAERANLQKVSTTSNTATVRFYLKSTVGGQTFIKSVERTLTIADPAPTLNPTVVDGNTATVALTGSNAKLVKYYSDAKIAFGAAAVKSATLKSKKVTCGSKSLTADGTMQDVESGTFAFSVTDSRGNTTTKSVTKTLVNYIKLTCNMGGGVPDGTGKFTFTVSGNFFNASFGAVTNTLSVKYRYRVAGGTYSDYQDMTVSKSGNTYTATANLTGLDYTKSYQFQAQAADKLATVTTEEKTVRSTPVFDWGKDDFNFNVPVTILGRTVLGCGCTAHMGSNLGTIKSNVKTPMTVLDSSYGGMELSNGSIKIPEDGIYMVSGQIMVADGATGYYLGLQIDGSSHGGILDAYIGFSIGYGVIPSVPTLVQLQKGELVSMTARMSAATNGVLVNANARTKITIMKVY